MRALLSRLVAGGRVRGAHVAHRGRAAVRRASDLQGVAGVACVTAGTAVIAGIGVALLVLGGFLLLGAWAAGR